MNTTAPTKVIPTKDDVLRVAQELIKSNGYATSLDVKNKLRDEDFWALQQTVSSLLRDVVSEQGWITDTSNGTYNMYKIPTGTLSVDIFVNRFMDAAKMDLWFNRAFIPSLMDPANDDHGKRLTITDALENFMAHDVLEEEEVEWFAEGNNQEQVLEALLVRLVQENMLALTQNPTFKKTPIPVKVQQAHVSHNAPGSLTKRRKPRSVINDSINPSPNNRVTVNIDPVSHTQIDRRLTTEADRIKFSMNLSPETWVAYFNGADQVHFYNEKYTSDNVRTAYARLIGKKVQDVRACRVKNVGNWKI